MSSATLLTAVAGLLALAFVGRTLLALLPPGRPGSHQPAGLATTWAASHSLGLVAVGAVAALGAAAGVRVPPWTLVAAAGVLALLRFATLPGALVPEHEHAPPRGRLPRVAALFAFAALAWPTLQLARDPVRSMDPLATAADGSSRGSASGLSPEDEPAPVSASGAVAAEVPLDLAAHPWAQAGCVFLSVARRRYDPDAGRLLPGVSLLALGLLLAHGMERARRSALGRWLVVLLFASLPPVAAAARAGHPALVVALFAGAGAVFVIPWLRRADRRAGFLALVLFAACAAAGGAAWAPGAAGLGVLLLATHRNARAPLLVAALAVLALLIVPSRLTAPAAPAAGAPDAAAALELLRAALADLPRWGLLWVAVLGAALLWASGFAGGRLRDEPGRAEQPRRELAALFAVLALTLVSAATSASAAAVPGPVLEAQLLWATPVAVLCAALVFLRGEPAPAAP